MSPNNHERATLAFHDATKRMRVGYTIMDARNVCAEYWICFVRVNIGGSIVTFLEHYSGRNTSDIVKLRNLDWDSRIKALSNTTAEEFLEDTHEFWEAYFGPPKLQQPAAPVQSVTHSRTEHAPPNMTRSHQPAKDVGLPDNSAKKRKADGPIPIVDNDRNKKPKQAEVMGPASRSQALLAKRRRQELQTEHAGTVISPQNSVSEYCEEFLENEAFWTLRVELDQWRRARGDKQDKPWMHKEAYKAAVKKISSRGRS